MKQLKINTVVCLSIITIIDLIATGNGGASITLWILYGIYKVYLAFIAD